MKALVNILVLLPFVAIGCVYYFVYTQASQEESSPRIFWKDPQSLHEALSTVEFPKDVVLDKTPFGSTLTNYTADPVSADLFEVPLGDIADGSINYTALIETFGAGKLVRLEVRFEFQDGTSRLIRGTPAARNHDPESFPSFSERRVIYFLEPGKRVQKAVLGVHFEGRATVELFALGLGTDQSRYFNRETPFYLGFAVIVFVIWTAAVNVAGCGLARKGLWTRLLMMNPTFHIAFLGPLLLVGFEAKSMGCPWWFWVFPSLLALIALANSIIFYGWLFPRFFREAEERKISAAAI